MNHFLMLWYRYDVWLEGYTRIDGGAKEASGR